MVIADAEKEMILDTKFRNGKEWTRRFLSGSKLFVGFLYDSFSFVFELRSFRLNSEND